MRIPVDPLNPLERLPPGEPDMRQAEAVHAVRPIGPGRQAQYLPGGGGKGGQAATEQQDAHQGDADYAGEERRQGERRADSKPALLDTRIRRDRRKRQDKPRVDLKV
jgi:hypothetical protein